MSGFNFALALVVALLSFCSAEIIVQDNLNAGIGLPTSGGDNGQGHNGIYHLDSTVTTSPYRLYIHVNNGQGPNSPYSGTVESFYVNSAGVPVVGSSQVQFGDSILISQQYSSTFQKDAGVSGNYLRDASNPNNQTGTYTFVFTIPGLSMLRLFNFTYVQSALTPKPIALFISLQVYNPSSNELIVQDNFGNGIGLPTSGGDNGQGHNFIIILDSTVTTSPYHLYVNVNNGQGPNSPYSGTVESFYVNSAGVPVAGSSQVQFGDCTLVSQQYSSTFQKDAGVSGNYLRDASNPNNATGTYTFVFTIPGLSTLRLFNFTYVQSAPTPTPIAYFISLQIYNPVRDPVVVGDPQFVGLRGQSYQVHGIDGAVYNIVSEKNTQVNSRFVFLTEGVCPIIDGAKDVNCWSHPGSYLGEISFQAVVDGKLHAALVQSGSASEGFSGVEVDGHALSVGDSVEVGDFSIEYVSTHRVFVTTESFEFQLSNSDMFINQALRLRVPLPQLTAHGLIGQTHSDKIYATAIKYIEGKVDDYVIHDGDMFGSDFLYNQFQL